MGLMKLLVSTDSHRNHKKLSLEITVGHHLWKSVFEHNFQLYSWKLYSKTLFHRWCSTVISRLEKLLLHSDLLIMLHAFLWNSVKIIKNLFFLKIFDVTPDNGFYLMLNNPLKLRCTKINMRKITLTCKIWY